MNIMKQNKKYVVIICVLALLVSFLSVCSFADDNESQSFSGTIVPVTLNDASDLRTNGLLAGTNTLSDHNVYIGTNTANTVYAFVYGEGTGYYRLVVASLVNSTVYYFSSGANAIGSGDINILNDSTGLYYWSFANTYVYSMVPQIDVFLTLQDGLDAVKDYIDNVPVSNPHSISNYPLPAGNAMIIDISGINGTGILSQNTVDAYWTYASNQAGGSSRSVPNPITLPLSFISEYTWSKTGKSNLLGQTRSHQTTFTYNGGTQNQLYYVITNPTVNDYISGDGVQTPIRENATLYVSMSNINSFQIVQFNTEYSYGGVWTATQSGDTGTGTFNEDTGEWEVTNDLTGDPFVPTFGGDNAVDSGGTTINDWLQTIANSISGFFKGAIGAVTTLVSAGQAFFNVLTGLYTWLPPAVFSVLSSALVIVITIGVIKVFI